MNENTTEPWMPFIGDHDDEWSDYKRCAILRKNELLLESVACETIPFMLLHTRFVCETRYSDFVGFEPNVHIYEHFKLLAMLVSMVVDGDVKDTELRLCPEHWHHYNAHCFKPEIDQPVIWHVAKHRCAHQNAQLTTLRDVNEQKFVFELMRHYLAANNLSLEFWLGASDIKKENKWKWVDGSRFKHSNAIWQDANPPYFHSQPSGGERANCLAMTTHGKLQDLCCHCNYAKLPFVCKMEPSLRLKDDMKLLKIFGVTAPPTVQTGFGV